MSAVGSTLDYFLKGLDMEIDFGNTELIPRGTRLDALINSHRGQTITEDNTIDNLRWFKVVLFRDHMRFIGSQLVPIEIQYACWAYGEQAAGRASAADLLKPDPGWTLPAEVRRQYQELDKITFRSHLAATELLGKWDYLGGLTAGNPTFPGEIGDYLGIRSGESVTLTVPGREHTLRAVRGRSGAVHMIGIGAALASFGLAEGEFWIDISKDRELSFSTTGFWKTLDEMVQEELALEDKDTEAEGSNVPAR